MSETEPVYIIVDNVQLLGNDNDLVSNNAVSKSYADASLAQAVLSISETTSSLQSQITSEGSSREAGDVALGVRIDDEKKAAEDALAQAIMSVSETTSSLQSQATAEQKAREDADVALGVRVDDEKKAAEDALAQAVMSISETTSSLQSQASAEQKSREDADVALGVRVDDEKKAAEDALAQAIMSVSEMTSSLQSQITSEQKAREDEDMRLDSVKFDKAGGAVSGDLTLDSYLNFGANWRVKASGDGSRIVFEFKRGAVWKTALPFICKSA